MSNNLENYEEKYNQALKRAKEFMTNKGVSPNADAFKTAKELTETIFPELRESEDERIRKEMIDFIQETIENVGESPNIWTMNNAKKWLSWLEKQGEKSWSEEDEEMIDFMIEFIESLYWRKDLTKRKDEVLSWLKSLKPQNRWKPSEEQMEALKYFISFHEDHARSLTTKWEEFKNLESLYNDIKKL